MDHVSVICKLAMEWYQYAHVRQLTVSLEP